MQEVGGQIGAPFIKLVSYAHLLWKLLRVVDVHCLAPGVGYYMAPMKAFPSNRSLLVESSPMKAFPSNRSLLVESSIDW